MFSFFKIDSVIDESCRCSSVSLPLSDKIHRILLLGQDGRTHPLSPPPRITINFSVYRQQSPKICYVYDQQSYFFIRVYILSFRLPHFKCCHCKYGQNYSYQPKRVTIFGSAIGAIGFESAHRYRHSRFLEMMMQRCHLKIRLPTPYFFFVYLK